MIVIDSSAIVAILLDEPESQSFHKALSQEQRCVISAINAHESIIVMRIRRGPSGVEALRTLINDLTIEIVPFDEAQVHAAADAFERFGKGIHPKARLNLCDCAAYALARTIGAPLLFKGDDFSHTDIASAV